jgi:tetratricopeptide (TPR) repeat protein
MSAPNPFPGLRPFEAEENHLFFGRDGQSDEILARLRRNRFVAVVGTSGSGKSSLIRAGLLPSLYGGFMAKAGSNWRVAIFRPGNHPIGNLAVALNAPGVLGDRVADAETSTLIIETTLRRSALGLIETVRQARMPAKENLLIVVDQFEELFRFRTDAKREASEDDAAAFVKLLVEATQQSDVPIYVVITMRSDFIGDCARFRELPETINQGLYLIPLMTRDQRRHAITGPAAVAATEMAPRLINRLLNDVGENPDQLPILQHALMRTWGYWASNHKNGEPIDLRDYEDIGGMAEALSRHADKAYNELPDDRSRQLAEKLFKSLTEKGTDNREVRRPTTVAEICAIAEADEKQLIAVIEAFRRPGRSFLMPPFDVPIDSDSLIDVSHESLIRGWDRLKDWVEGEVVSAAIYRRVAETAALYQEAKAGLWRDPDLQVALGWRDKANPNKAWGERYHPGFDSAMRFLDESKAARDRALIERERRRKRQLRQTRAFALVLLLAFLISSVLGVWAMAQTKRAKRQEERANQKAAEANQERNEAEEQKGIAYRNALEANKQKESAHKTLEALQKTTGALEKSNVKKTKAEQSAKQSAGQAETRRRQAVEAQRQAVEAQNVALENVRTNVVRFDDLYGSTKHQPDVQLFYDQLLQGAIKVSDTVLDHNPDNEQAMALRMIYQARIPDLHRSQGKLDQAKEDCDKYEKVAEQMERDRSYFRRTLSAALLSSMADARMRLKEEDAAVLGAQRAAKVADTVGPDADPRNGLNWRLLSTTYSVTGGVQERYGHLKEALQDYQKAIEARHKAPNPSVDSNRRLLDDMEKVANVQIRLGQNDNALGIYEEAIKSAETWTSGDGAKPKLVHDLVWLYLYRGDAQRKANHFAEAEADYNSAKSTAERLDATTEDAQYDHANVEGRFGTLWRDRAKLEQDSNRKQEDLEKARKYYRAQMDSYERAAQLDPSDENTRHVADAYQRFASLEGEAGNVAAALKATDERIRLLTPLGSRPGADAGDKTLLADAFGSRSWFDLFLGDFNGAISDARQGLAYDDKQVWIHTNEAHGHLFLGQVKEARKIYLENADKRAYPDGSDSKTFQTAVLEDFEEFKRRPNPKMDLHAIDDIAKELKTKPAIR